MMKNDSFSLTHAIPPSSISGTGAEGICGLCDSELVVGKYGTVVGSREEVVSIRLIVCRC